MFFIFLMTPTVVSILDRKADTSYFYNMAEEEENHVSFEAINVSSQLFINCESVSVSCSKNNLFLNRNEVILESLSALIFLPPPELS
ncbi:MULTISPECIES: hypothetical protein [Flavobacterium]|nr:MULTISPECIES: hypothetical protein [Flavobacterium]